jgi:hypothetical protein
LTVGFLGGAAGAGFATFGGGGGAFDVLTAGFGLAFGAGASFVAGLDAVMLGFGGGAFKAATFGARERGFLDERRAVVRLLEDFPGRLKVTGAKSWNVPAPAPDGCLASIRDLGIRDGGSKRSPVRLGKATGPLGIGPTPLSPKTLKSIITWFEASQGLS